MSHPGLKLTPGTDAHVRVVGLAGDRGDTAGLGLDWTAVPEELAGYGRAAWAHLAETFREVPTRFREGDRHAVVAYCAAREMAELAAAALREHGVLVEGRSESDRGRPVRSPAWAMWRDASTQLRQWSVELGLTPSARQRSRLSEDAEPDDGDNPFAGSAGPAA